MNCYIFQLSQEDRNLCFQITSGNYRPLLKFLLFSYTSIFSCKMSIFVTINEFYL